MPDGERVELSMMDLFAASAFQPVRFEADQVHAMYWAPVKTGDVVQIEWLSAASPGLQGVMLRLRRPGVAGKKGVGGTLKWEGHEGAAIRLWMDGSGPVAQVLCTDVNQRRQAAGDQSLGGAERARRRHLNYYGILVERIDDDTAVLHCSDGFGARPSFDDQVVEITIHRLHGD